MASSEEVTQDEGLSASSSCASFNTRMLVSTASSSSSYSSELFNLKVMRFPQPFLKTASCVVSSLAAVEEDGSPQMALQTEHKSGTTYLDKGALSNALRLVAERKKVYLGENSRMCVIISHNSDRPVSSVGVRIEVQTQKSRQILVDSIKRPQNLAAGQTMDYLLDFKLTDAGENALVCCVFYRDEDNQVKNFQKFFRFAVDEPFRVDTKVTSVTNITTIARLAITNLADDPIFIEALQFRNRENIAVQDLNDAMFHNNDNDLGDTKQIKDEHGDALSSSSSSSSSSQLLNTNAVSCFAFKLTKSNIPKIGGRDRANPADLGCVEIRWRRSGHVGVLKTKALVNPHRSSDNARCSLSIVEAPDKVLIERVFHVTVEIESKSTRHLHLRLSIPSHKHLSIVPAGVSNYSCGVLKMNEKRRVKVALLPLALGIQKISGFKLRCPEIGFTADFDDLHQCCVMKTSTV